MNRSSIFWGMVFVVLGGLLLLENFAILSFSVWKLFWPTLVILLGLWVLWQSRYGGEALETESASIPLEGVDEAHIAMHHGAGDLRIHGGAPVTELLSGTFDGGVQQISKRSGNRLDVILKVPIRGFPFMVFPWFFSPGNRICWDVAIHPHIPISLEVRSGANDARLDLTDTRVTSLALHTGASATQVHLPARVEHSRVKVEAGAASVEMYVPEGVAARLEVDGGLLNLDVDQTRFPKTGKVYQSPDFDTAPYRVEIKVDAGAGSISVH
ncbi:MAG: hypothetical protein FJ010_02795 [Chloroflexi bacterium]|nr:hypothetical protein [Chloroflexota bacterium]